MCNGKDKSLNNLHKNSKVFLVSRNICHRHYFYPTYNLTFSMKITKRQTSKKSCECSFICAIFSKLEKIPKIVINKRAL